MATRRPRAPKPQEDPENTDETPDAPTETPDELRQEPGAPPDGMTPEDLFDLAASMDGARVHVARWNGRSGDYAMVGILQAPATWEQIANRWGGGLYRWTVKVQGRYHSGGRFEISEEAYPSPRAKNRLPDDEEGDTLRRRLAELEARLAAQPPAPQQTGLDIEKIVGVIGQVLGVMKGAGGPSDMTAILEAVKLGKELAAEGGGGGSGLGDLAGEVVPAILTALRNARQPLAAQPRPRPQPTATPNPGTPPPPETMDQLNRRYAQATIQAIIEKAMKGGDPAEAAAKAETDLPAGLLDGLRILTAEEAIERIGQIVPSARAWTEGPEARMWVKGFLATLNAPEDEGEEDPDTNA